MKARHDARDPGGSILLCASLSALTGTVGMQHYNAAKGALASMARGIAVEMGRYGVRCNTVCPGYTRTNISESMDLAHIDPAGTQRAMVYTNIAPAVLEPEDIAWLALFLASDESRHVNGAIIPADAGWSVA